MSTNVIVIVEGKGLTDGEKEIIKGMVKLTLMMAEKQHEMLGELVSNINDKHAGGAEFGERDVSVPHFSPVYEIQEYVKEVFPNITIRIEPAPRGIRMV